jgi:outer membrane protein TolC
MKRYFVCYLLATLLFSPAILAQDTLSLSQALMIAMENNFNISLASNDSRIARLNNTAGNAGYLPQLGITGARSMSVNNTYQQYYDGRERSSDAARNDNISAGMALSWTLFDGFDMFMQKKKLSELEGLSEIQLQATIENTASDVISAYYTVVTQRKMVEVYREAMAITSERKRIAKAGVGFGTSSELSLLQASVDYNADSSAYIQQVKLLQNAKIDLNRILCRDLHIPFETHTDIPIRADLDLDQLWEMVSAQNPEIRISRTNLSVALLERKSANSTLYPQLNFTSGYTYSKSQSEVGIMQMNQNRGYNVGINASYTIFDGFTQKQNRSKAQINLESAKIAAEQTELDIKAYLQRLFNDYQTNLQLSAFEKENVALAQRNLAIATEKYRIGSANDIELRETQKKLMDAENRYLTALFRCKTGETELLRMSGGLKN